MPLPNPGWELGYQGVQQFQDIRLTQAARVDASGGGSIPLQGRQLTLVERHWVTLQKQPVLFQAFQSLLSTNGLVYLESSLVHQLNSMELNQPVGR